MPPIKAKHVAFNHFSVPGGSHIAVVDEMGRLWERFTDMPPGAWSRVPLPEDPQVKPRRRKRRRP
jgi:hypothetical protein